MMVEPASLLGMGAAAFAYAESQRGALDRLFLQVEKRLINPPV
jgi:3-deoxy-D-manno-octulosonic-acid transferase